MSNARVVVEAVEPRRLFASTNVHLVLSPLPASVEAGYSFTHVTVSLEDATGAVVTGGAPVAVSLQLTGTGSTTAVETEDTVAGVATFVGPFSADAADPVTFVATANAFDTVTSAAVTVTPGPAIGLFNYAADTADPGVGQPYGGATVSAYNRYGNLTTASDGEALNVSLTGPDGNTIAGPAAVVHGNQAEIAQGMVFTAMGLYEVQVTDATSGAVVSKFDLYVEGGPPAKLALVSIQPTLKTLPGVPIDGLGVLLVDAYNEPAGGTPTVTLSVNPAGSAVTGSLSVAAHEGSASFDDVSFLAPGTYTFTATCGNLPPTKLGPIHVANRSTTTVTRAGQALAPVTFDLADDLDGETLPRKVGVEVLDPNQDVIQRRVLPVAHGKVVVTGIAPRQAGDYTLVVSDSTGDGQFEAQSFTVLPGPAARATFASQPTITDGQLSATVQLVDRFGNVTQESDGATATIAAARGTAGRGVALSGTRTAVVAGGQAAFTGVPVTSTVAGSRPRLTVTVGRLAVTSDPLAWPLST